MPENIDILVSSGKYIRVDTSDLMLREQAACIVMQVGNQMGDAPDLVSWLAHPGVHAVLCTHVAASIGIERERCARVAESEPAMPRSPWEELGFWRSLHHLWLSLTRPFLAARAASLSTSCNIARRIRARSEI